MPVDHKAKKVVLLQRRIPEDRTIRRKPYELDETTQHAESDSQAVLVDHDQDANRCASLGHVIPYDPRSPCRSFSRCEDRSISRRHHSA